jgi:Ricin-type beta-trefoil lectin domain-like
MSFTPSDTIFYRILAKHSMKVVTVLDGQLSRGALVGQMPYDANADSQLFRLRRLNTWYYAITAKHSGKNLDVPGAGGADGTQVVQWDPSDNEGNEQFRFERAGDGWYYIIVQHSNKAIAVHDSPADRTALVQWTKHPNPNFMFRFVPDGQAVDNITGRPLVGDASALMRTIIIGIAGKIPEIGSGLGPLLTLLWPDDSQTRIWEQMKNYVSALVGELIAQQQLNALWLKLAGLRNVLKTYELEKYGTTKKRGAFDALLAAFDEAEPMFFSRADPVSTLPCFVAMGTIRLAALRELCLSYERIYLEPDQSAAERLKDLKTNIATYKAAADSARDRAVAWRLAKIVVEDEQSKEFGALGPSTTHTWRARDAYDGWSRQWSYNTLTGGELQAESLARKAKTDREGLIRATFSADLDRVLGPSRLWRYLDPGVTDKPRQVATDIVVGPYGGGAGTAFADNPTQRITTILVYAGSRVDGVEFYYGGVSGGLHGARGGTTYRLDLWPGELVVGAWGRSGAALDALFFETSSGRRIGGGGAGGNEFIGEPPDEMFATLTKISGIQGDKNLQSITFTWSYYRDE